MAKLRIGQLARDAEVGVETVRYYQRIGLMPTPPKPLGGSRHYDQGHLQRLRFIRRAQALGFSLDDIRQLLALGEDHCHDVAALAAAKLGSVREKIAELRRLERTLAQTVDQCQCNSDETHCPIIQSLTDGR